MTASKKTVLRTIRLSAEHDRILEEDARKKGLSVNSLLTTLITKYAEWDRFAERFGYVSIGRQGFGRLFDFLTDEALVTHGRDAGGRNAPEITRFWFGKLNIETFFSFLTVHSKYSGIYHYELISSGRTRTIVFHHELGPRYSIVLANYFDQAIKKIVGVAPKVEIGDSSCTLSFDEPHP
ncbi:MAG: hypothetical protein OK474_10285 [Thaumarchaeota archaeon]|nr:hypothetical protein [Nitrososphaerota archaeon]